MNFGRVNFGPVTDEQTDSDAYEPTVHTQRWAVFPDMRQFSAQDGFSQYIN